MTLYLSSLRSFNRDIRLFLVSAFLIGFTFDGGIYTVIFNLFLLRLGYGPEFVGQVNSAGLMAFALFSLPAGLLSSRWSSRRIMIAGLGLMLLGCGLLPLVQFIPTGWQAGWLHLTYIFILLGLALYFVNAAPFIMRSARPGNHNHAFSVQVALLSLAAFAGSLVGGILPGLFAGWLELPLDRAEPYGYPLLLAAALLIPALLAMKATSRLKPAPALPATSGGNRGDRAGKGSGIGLSLAAFPLALVAVLVAVRFFQVAGMATTFIFFNVYLDTTLQVSTAQIGALLAIGRLVAVPVALTTPLLAERYSNRRLVVWSSFLGAISMLPLAFVPHWGAAGLSFIGIMAFSSIRFPTFLAFSMEVVTPEQQSTVSGAGETAAGLSFSAMALSGGYIVTALGYQALFLLGAGISALGAFFFWVYFRKPRGQFVRPNKIFV